MRCSFYNKNGDHESFCFHKKGRRTLKDKVEHSIPERCSSFKRK